MPEDEKWYRNYVNPNLENIFSYHAPKEGQPELYEEIREKAKDFAYFIVATSPIMGAAEREQALLRLQEAVFWANAGVARGTANEIG